MNYITAAITAVVVGLMAYGLHSLDVNHLKAQSAKALIEAANQATLNCNAEKLLTTEVSNEYQKNLSGLDAATAAVRSVYASDSCLSVTGGGTAGRDGQASADQPSGTGHAGYTAHAAINISKFIDIAAEGEKYRLQLMACQNFVNKVENGQKRPK